MNHTIQSSFPPNLKVIKELVYDKLHWKISHLQINTESTEYSACSFQLNGHPIIFRASKVTPTKAGQFVSIWKRNHGGITAPFHVSDDFDFIVIVSNSADRMGQFIFPKSVLVEQGIVSKDGKGGKRGIRVYPPWDKVTSAQAIKTQSWQVKYFVSITPCIDADMDLISKLFEEKQV